MIPYTITEAADRAALRYDTLAQTFSALYKSALMSSDFGSVGHAQKLFADAYAAAEPYFSVDKDKLETIAEGIASDAHQSVLAGLRSIAADELSDEALAHVSETQTYVSNEIAAQVHRDIAQMRLQLQRVVLDVGLVSRTRRLDARKAQVAHMLANQEDLVLQFVDRRGRRTPSRTFVRSIYRHSLLSIHNETVLHALADHGLEHAAIMRVEEGTVVKVGRMMIEHYAVSRGELFHPNSNAYLAVETDDV